MLTDRYTISILTFGPGEHPFLKFGHNAILVADHRLRRTEVYNFGTFDFRNPHLIQDFLKGRLTYWVSVMDFQRALAPYAVEGRSAESQELALTPKMEHQLVDKLRHTALPENREYRYDYYRNNCSTKIRDIIDEVTGGSLKDVSGDDAHFNWREHTLRLTQDDAPVALGLHVLLGPETDQPRRVWEEMFLPPILAETLDHAQIEVEGHSQPLVKKKTVELEPATPAAPPVEPPTWWGGSLLLGALFGATAFGIGATGTSGRSAFGKVSRAALWFLTGFWGLISGFFGFAFLFLWTTDHQIAYANHNLFSLQPWGLALVACAIGARWWKQAHRLVARLCGLSFVATLVGLLVRLFLPNAQNTSFFLALAAPIWLGLALAHHRLAKRAARPDSL